MSVAEEQAWAERLQAVIENAGTDEEFKLKLQTILAPCLKPHPHAQKPKTPTLSDCTHHWRSPLATGLTSIETCLKCGAQREVANVLPIFWTNEKHDTSPYEAIPLGYAALAVSRGTMGRER